MAHSIGPKEQQRIDLRLKRFKERGPGATGKPYPKLMPYQKAVIEALTEAPASKPLNAPVLASAPIKESLMKKVKATAAKMTAKRKTKTSKRLKAVSTGKADTFKVQGLAAAKKAAKPRKPAPDRKVVPALDVARFMAREGGASMAELVKQFGIEAHPMRAKVHYVRNQIAGWAVETKDGRYYATGPA